jgi:hypothetical protein
MKPWPRCVCGGPAVPNGAPVLVTIFEVDTRSEANVRGGFWREAKRKASARDATIEALAFAGARCPLPEVGPFYVRLTRISSGKLDDDNLARALKTVRDTIAAALKVDDGDAGIAFRYAQAKGERDGTRKGVRVEIWGGEAAP